MWNGERVAKASSGMHKQDCSEPPEKAFIGGIVWILSYTTFLCSGWLCMIKLDADFRSGKINSGLACQLPNHGEQPLTILDAACCLSAGWQMETGWLTGGGRHGHCLHMMMSLLVWPRSASILPSWHCHACPQTLWGFCRVFGLVTENHPSTVLGFLCCAGRDVFAQQRLCTSCSNYLPSPISFKLPGNHNDPSTYAFSIVPLQPCVIASWGCQESFHMPVISQAM